MLSVVVGVPVVIVAVVLLFRPPSPATESGLAYPSTTTSDAVSTESGPIFDDGRESAPTTVTAVVMVHVAGRVGRPGVYSLSLGSRVVDAVEAAGGSAQFADLDSVNLASVLSDGQQVYIPAFGEAPHAVVGSASVPVTTVVFSPVNLNTADVGQLDSLPGIGPATARAIVDHRTEKGPFASVEALEDVPGIGAAKVERLAGLVTV